MALSITINKVAVADSFAAGTKVADIVASGGTSPYAYEFATGGDYFQINGTEVQVINDMDINNIQSFSVTATDSTSGTALTVTSEETYPNLTARIQSRFNSADKIYKITQDIDLGHGVLTVPYSCTLDFQGGSFRNGVIQGNKTKIKSSLDMIFHISCTISGTWCVTQSFPEWFGYIKDSTTIDAGVCINKAFDISKSVKLGTGTYNIQTPIVLKSTYHLEGSGNNNTIITKTSSTEKYNDINAVIYVDRDSTIFASYIDIQHLQIYSDSYNITYGIYLSGCALSNFANLVIIGCQYGIYGSDSTGQLWNINFYNVQCNCSTIRNEENDYGWEAHTSYGFYLKPTSVTGTTLSFDKCWARDAAYGFNIENINYSSMNSCAADNICGAAYRLVNVTCTLNGCGCEKIYCDANYNGALHLYNCQTVINNFVGYNVTCKSGVYTSMLTIGMGHIIFNCCNFPDYQTTTGYNIRLTNNAKVFFYNPVHMTSNGASGDSIEEGCIYLVDYGDQSRVRSFAYATYNYNWRQYLNIGTTAQRPSPTDAHKGFMYYDTDMKTPIFWSGTSFMDANGFPVVKKSGTTSERPALDPMFVGFIYFDTDLGKSIVFNGTTWVNLDGTVLAENTSLLEEIPANQDKTN